MGHPFLRISRGCGRGARAVVTGQQVGLLGGPLLTLLKAATAVAKAKEASVATGVEHVPVFWLASEDHDLAEVDQVSLPGKNAIETLRLGLKNAGGEVGGVVLGTEVSRLLDEASELLAYAPVCDLLRECYTPGATLGGAFARLMARLFARHGLIVMDAAGREFHALGAKTLAGAIERAEELEAALLKRTAELETGGYHAQVLVKAGASLLFLVDEETGVRLPLRRVGGRGGPTHREEQERDEWGTEGSEPDRPVPLRRVDGGGGPTHREEQERDEWGTEGSEPGRPVPLRRVDGGGGPTHREEQERDEWGTEGSEPDRPVPLRRVDGGGGPTHREEQERDEWGTEGSEPDRPVPLRRVGGGGGPTHREEQERDEWGTQAWKAGSKNYTSADLLGILAAAPERLSPNALLRPVFQDTILPTAAYVGGPAEVAYFAQIGGAV